MHVRRLCIQVLIVFLLVAPGIAHGQGTNSLDISIPASFPLARTQAYNSSYNMVEVWGPVDLFKYGAGVYVVIPTNASPGDKLVFFQDTNVSWSLFRNNTLALPVQGQANLLLATGDLVSDGTRFYGQVTGIELNARALGGEGASAVAMLYLDELPVRPSYRVSLTEDEEVEKAVMGEASKGGQPGKVKLMLEVSGMNAEAQGSIGYTIVHMKADSEPDGNVAAYRYFNGAVSRLPCKAVTSAEGPVYETIYAGPGTFALVGPFPEPPTAKPGIPGIVLFASAIATLQIALVWGIIKIFKKAAKR